jgi:hypothetical protein
LQDPENKEGGFARSRKSWSYGFFGAFGRHKPEAGGFYLDLGLIIRGVSSRLGGWEFRDQKSPLTCKAVNPTL